MQHSFVDFLRHGGDGQYVVAQQGGRLVGRRVGLSLKSSFPNYAPLRADFSERLDQVVSENTRLLLTHGTRVLRVFSANTKIIRNGCGHCEQPWKSVSFGLLRD